MSGHFPLLIMTGHPAAGQPFETGDLRTRQGKSFLLREENTGRGSTSLEFVCGRLAVDSSKKHF